MEQSSRGRPGFLLPAVVLKRIMDFLPLRERMTFAKVCHQWRNFVLSCSSVWKNVSIDWSSPFGGEWRKTGQKVKVDNMKRSVDKEREEYGDCMERFIVHLADMTKSIENFEVILSSWGLCYTNSFRFKLCGLGIAESIHKLLMNQKKLVSLKLVLPRTTNSYNFAATGNSHLKSETERLVVEVIAKHQNTLEHLDLIDADDISLDVLADKLSAAEFPNLRSIGYPGLVQLFMEPATLTRVKQWFYRTLKHGNVEEINVRSRFTRWCPSWRDELSSALLSVIKEGFTPNLKKFSSVLCILLNMVQ